MLTPASRFLLMVNHTKQGQTMSESLMLVSVCMLYNQQSAAHSAMTYYFIGSGLRAI